MSDGKNIMYDSDGLIGHKLDMFYPWSENSTHENSTHENSTHENSTQRKFHPAKIPPSEN